MSVTSTPPTRFVLIINPAAGKGRAARELVRLRHCLLRHEVEAEIFLTEAEGHAAVLLQGLQLAPGSVVVAVGGDGTAHEVGVALLDHPEVALGVVPVGSGNDYAGLLGMSSHPITALESILAGRETRWDVGMVGPHAFLNTVGFGLSAAVSYQSRHTGPLTGLARYGLAIVRALARHRPLPLVVDGLEASGSHRLTLMEIGIGDRCGGGFRLTTKADPADGLLDVCMVDDMSRLRMPLLLPRGRRGRHLGHPAVTYEQLASFRLRLESDAMVHVDGEIRVLGRGEHSVRVRPKALRLRLPASTSNGGEA